MPTEQINGLHVHGKKTVKGERTNVLLNTQNCPIAAVKRKKSWRVSEPIGFPKNFLCYLIPLFLKKTTSDILYSRRGQFCDIGVYFMVNTLLSVSFYDWNLCDCRSPLRRMVALNRKRNPRHMNAQLFPASRPQINHSLSFETDETMPVHHTYPLFITYSVLS